MTYETLWANTHTRSRVKNDILSTKTELPELKRINLHRSCCYYLFDLYYITFVWQCDLTILLRVSLESKTIASHLRSMSGGKTIQNIIQVTDKEGKSKLINKWEKQREWCECIISVSDIQLQKEKFRCLHSSLLAFCLKICVITIDDMLNTWCNIYILLSTLF